MRRPAAERYKKTASITIFIAIEAGALPFPECGRSWQQTPKHLLPLNSFKSYLIHRIWKALLCKAFPYTAGKP